MNTSLTWNTVGEGFESTDWHFEIVPGSTPGLYDVRDLVEREWFAHDVTLEQAKQACENVHADQLRDERPTCRHCGVEGEDTGGECPRCEHDRDTGLVVTRTGDDTYTGFVVKVPGADQVEVVSVYCEDPDEQARADMIAHRIALRIHTLLS